MVGGTLPRADRAGGLTEREHGYILRILDYSDAEATDMARTRAEKIALVADLLPQVMSGLVERQPIQAGDWHLTMAQIRVLMAVAHDQECTMGALSGRLGVGLSATTELVDRLVEGGVIERVPDPSDRRVVRVRLSEPGRRAGQAYRREQVRQMEEILRGVPSDEIERIVEGVKLLLGAVVRGNEGRGGKRAGRKRPVTCEDDGS